MCCVPRADAMTVSEQPADDVHETQGKVAALPSSLITIRSGLYIIV